VGAVEESYERGETDEFVRPTVIGDYDGMADGDAVLHFNFRPDRARELVMALGEPDFDEFPRGDSPDLELTTLTEYRKNWGYPVAFPPRVPEVTLAQVIATGDANQLHVAETEKYAHVTYFFNGGREDEWAGETRILVPSPRDVPSYDHKPEMSAREVAARFSAEVGKGYGFAVVNFANPDMVGHTGSIPAVTKAVETTDKCLGEVVAAVERAGGVSLITADHGNAEQMLEADGTSPHTAHTTNPVPLVLTKEGMTLAESGELSDLMPTGLALLGFAQPLQMTGKSLLR